jgi:type IV pilus assembly protein PilP
VNRAIACAAALAFASLAACSPDTTLEVANTGASRPAPPTLVPDAGEESEPPQPLGKIEFSENDFVESDRNRDPFRSYVAVFSPEPDRRTSQNQRTVVLGQYSLDELKLVAIVTRGDYPRAMVLDPNGKGWVLKRGDFVGRPEIVHIGGANGTDYQLNWRVEKVRDGDVVFTREDPAQPGIPPVSRVVTLHPEADSQEARLEN